MSLYKNVCLFILCTTFLGLLLNIYGLHFSSFLIIAIPELMFAMYANATLGLSVGFIYILITVVVCVSLFPGAKLKYTIALSVLIFLSIFMIN